MFLRTDGQPNGVSVVKHMHDRPGALFPHNEIQGFSTLDRKVKGETAASRCAC